MYRQLIFAISLALASQAAHAAQAGKPPAELASYVAAMRKADAIADPLQRCLAYPDLPGNTWPAGVAKARCTMFLTPVRYSLGDIEKLLAQPKGAATLDAAFATLLEQHFSVPAQREQISIALAVFKDADRDRAERVARAWVSAVPDSAYAHAALGHVLARRGWDARGTKYASDTSADALGRMSDYFVKAAMEYGAALNANPRLLPACVGLMAIGRQSSDALRVDATQRCLAADPASFYVIDEMMNAAEPRWGGSDEAMRKVAAYALEKAAQNPVLVLFASDDTYYRIDRMQDGDEAALAELVPAALKVPNAAYLRTVGGAYLRKGDDWHALAYLSQALRFSPAYAQETRFRAYALYRLGEIAWARTDAQRAVELDPKNARARQLLGNIVRRLDGPAAAAPYFRAAMDDADTREYAFNDYCGSLIDARRYDEAGKCVDELLVAFPNNPEAWRQRLVLIGFDAPGSTEAMQRFLALHDPARWDYHADVAATIRKVLAAKDGTASAGDLFDARVARAKAQERTPEGQAYFVRLRESSGSSLENAISACHAAPNGRQDSPPDFTAVMDLKPDGKPTNIAVLPINAWTTCMAKRIASSWTLPKPPEHAGAGYPLVYEVRMQRVDVKP